MSVSGAALANPDRLNRALATDERRTAKQRRLVTAFCTSGHRIQCAVGRPGAGKTPPSTAATPPPTTPSLSNSPASPPSTSPHLPRPSPDRPESDLDHAYAVTTWAVQGATNAVATGRIDPAATRAEACVDLHPRRRRSPWVHAVDESTLCAAPEVPVWHVPVVGRFPR
jgi:hypothetical protein